MARPTREVEIRREGLEGQLACLGNALFLIDLLTFRVGSAIDYTGQGPMWGPALDDLSHLKYLLNHTQDMIKASNPCVFGCHGGLCDK